MIAKVIAWCAKNRLATLLLVGLATSWGVLSVRGTALDAIAQKLAAGAYDAQNIVEIVSNAAGEAPDSFHLLRVTKLILGALLLCDVATDRGGADYFAFAVANRG